MGFKTISTLLISAGLGGAGYSGASYITPLFNRTTPTEDSKLVQQAERAWKGKFKDSNLSNVAFFAVCSKKTTEYEVFDGTKLDFKDCNNLENLQAFTWNEQEDQPTVNGLFWRKRDGSTNQVNNEKLLFIEKLPAKAPKSHAIKTTGILKKLGLSDFGDTWYYCQKLTKKLKTSEECISDKSNPTMKYKFQEYFGKVKKVFYVSYDKELGDLKDKEGVLTIESPK